MYGVHGTTCTLASEGTLRYIAPAVSNLQVTIGITGSGSAYSNATSAGVVTTHLLALTPAALDAAAGAAGFGGLAYVPGVGSFTVGDVTP